MTRYDDVSVCRDQTGGLPDFGLDPVTPRGIRLGDAESRVIELYGAPFDRRLPFAFGGRAVSAAEIILEYRPASNSPRTSVNNLRLFFTVKEGKVTDISLSGDMPGTKRPQ